MLAVTFYKMTEVAYGVKRGLDGDSAGPPSASAVGVALTKLSPASTTTVQRKRHQDRVDDALARPVSLFVPFVVIQPAVKSQGDCLFYAILNVLEEWQRKAVACSGPGRNPEDDFRDLIKQLGYDDTYRGFNFKDMRDYLFRRQAMKAMVDFVWCTHKTGMGDRVVQLFSGNWIAGDNIIVLGLAPESGELIDGVQVAITDAVKASTAKRPRWVPKRTTVGRGKYRKQNQLAVVEPSETQYALSLQIAAYHTGAARIPNRQWGSPHAIGVRVRDVPTEGGGVRTEKIIVDSAKITAKLLTVGNLADSLIRVDSVLRFGVTLG
jgi:hypothetical protein